MKTEMNKLYLTKWTKWKTMKKEINKLYSRNERNVKQWKKMNKLYSLNERNEKQWKKKWINYTHEMNEMKNNEKRNK
jgi:hypothetical protein